MTQAEFSRRRGVSRKAVTIWKNAGLITIQEDGLVDVEASEWALDQRPSKYRGGVTHRPVRTLPQDDRPSEPQQTKPSRQPDQPKVKRPTDLGDDDPPDEDWDGSDETNLPTPLAIRRKENWLGLQRKQAVEKEDRRLVDREAAEHLFFSEARDLRDAWLAWPARVAVSMADELNVDPRALTRILTAHVNQHLAELGEPDAQLH